MNLNNSGSGGSGNNPFRRQKQQSKNQQKYNQQLQMYSSSNRIPNTQQKGSHSKNNSNSIINYNARQQMQQAFNEQQMQQQIMLNNYNGHMRSLSNSNCSGNVLPNNTLSNFSTHQNLMLQHPNASSNNGGKSSHNRMVPGAGENQRKAPSSINLLNNTSMTNHLNNSNLLPANQGRMNLANVINMGNISMTHQNLLIQPQASIQLTAQQQKEQKVTEKQILESEEYFESGKVCLQDKKYKEATKMFTKSMQANQTNYDALFYRAVTNLD